MPSTCYGTVILFVWQLHEIVDRMRHPRNINSSSCEKNKSRNALHKEQRRGLSLLKTHRELSSKIIIVYMSNVHLTISLVFKFMKGEAAPAKTKSISTSFYTIYHSTYYVYLCETAILKCNNTLYIDAFIVLFFYLNLQYSISS